MKNLLVVLLCFMLTGCATKNARQIPDSSYDSVKPLITDDGKYVGTIYCKKEDDGSLSGKAYSLDNKFSGYMKAYLKNGEWWTDAYDENENLISRKKGISMHFKDLFDFEYRRIE